jgi:hypothetical protein
MYIVASLWEINPGQKAVAQPKGLEVRKVLRATPGVHSVTHFQPEENKVMAIIAYEDEAAYDRIINDPNGPFATAIKQHGLEDVMTWVQSWRGEASAD